MHLCCRPGAASRARAAAIYGDVTGCAAEKPTADPIMHRGTGNLVTRAFSGKGTDRAERCEGMAQIVKPKTSHADRLHKLRERRCEGVGPPRGAVRVWKHEMIDADTARVRRFQAFRPFCSEVCYTVITATLGDHKKAAHRYCRFLGGIKIRGSLLFLADQWG